MLVRAGELLGEGLPGVGPLLVDVVDLHEAVGESERGLERIGESAEDVGGGDETVDHDRDVVLHLLLQLRRLVEADDLAVDDGPGEALRGELPEQVDELALLLGDDGAQDLEASAVGEFHELIGDLLHRLALDGLAADRAVRDADARPQEAHVIVDLGDRADRRTRVAVGRLLVDGDRGAQPLDEVDVGPVDLPEELARVRGERLDVAPLTLGEDRVEGERGLAGAREPGEDHHRIARDLDVDVAEVVHAGTADTQSGVGIET